MTPAHPAPGAVRQVLPFASVLLQPNPGPMTLEGTNTWLLGELTDGVLADGGVVVDPGQSDNSGAEHLERLLAAAPRPGLVLITHRHHDHTQLAAAVHERTGAPVRAADPEHCHGGVPLVGGEVVQGGALRLEVLATPGHTSDSTSFVLDGGAAVVTGDMILGRGTTVVAHPDGNLRDYIDSLERLRALGPVPALPGHGGELPSVAETAAFYLAHRAERLEQVRAALARLGPDVTARQVVEDVYADVDRSVWDAAELSVQAQLEFLRT